MKKLTDKQIDRLLEELWIPHTIGVCFVPTPVVYEFWMDDSDDNEFCVLWTGKILFNDKKIGRSRKLFNRLHAAYREELKADEARKKSSEEKSIARFFGDE